MSMNAEATHPEPRIAERGARAVPPGAGLALAVVMGASFWLGVLFLVL